MEGEVTKGSTCDEPGFPVRICRRKGGMRVWLRRIPLDEFRDPFVEETARRVQGSEYFVDIPCLEAAIFEARHPLPAPSGLIFHVSKAGSTLLSQLLKCSAKITVYSQPRALNDILAPPTDWTPSETIAALQILGGLFFSHARRPYILKLESWNALFSALFARAYPETPWVFCVRDPIEVGVSAFEDPDPSSWLKQFGERDNPFASFLTPPVLLTNSKEEYFS